MLKYFGQEEGRIRPKRSVTDGSVTGFAYDYFVKDHLGNVRAVLSDETSGGNNYVAGMEDAARSTEVQLFDKIPETVTNKPTGFDDNAGNAKVSKLSGLSGDDKRVGPGVVLKVMKGDKFRAAVNAWYLPGTDVSQDPGLGSMVSSLASAFIGGIPATGGVHGLGAALQSSGNIAGPMTGFLNTAHGNSGTLPKAYLNWLILDEQQFELVAGNYGAAQVPAISGSMQKQVLTANGGSDIEVKQNGYLYVYVSNESRGNVYFDDIAVVHTPGALLEETHYYPFGLVMKGISSQQSNQKLKNKKLYNKGAELQNEEFYDGSGLELYSTFYRSLDPQIGRFWQIDPKPNYSESPYVSMGNNPISFNDSLGDTLLTKADHRRAARIEKQINKTNASLSKNITKLNGQIAAAQAKGNTNKVNSLQAKVNDANARINANTNTLNSLNAISNDQTQAYTFNQFPVGSTEGGTMLKTMSVNGNNQSVVVMNVLSDANAVHELIHAVQGTIQHMFTFNLDNVANPVTFLGATIFAAQQVNSSSELAAYQAQYGFDPGSMPSSTIGGVPGSMSNINPFYVGGLNGTDASGNSVPVYPNVQNMVNTILSLLRVAF